MPDDHKIWVMNYLRSEEGRKQIEYASTGNQLSMRNISQGSIREIIIPIPPLEEQKEIVRRVEKMFEKIDMMEQEYQKAAKLCDRLEQATLAKAFRGELVPQDPDDEPVSVFLEQVKSQKEKGSKIKHK
jgi:type I restriction enzyme S subunit